jgi:hypothetical protein
MPSPALFRDEHHLDNLDAISTVLGVGVDWCPTCGVRLAGR